MSAEPPAPPAFTDKPLSGPEVMPPSGKPDALIVLLHGYGSNGAALIELAPYFQAALPNAAFLAPNAPQECPGAPGGHQWWPIVTMERGERAYGAYYAAIAVNAFIDAALKRFGLKEDRLVLVGFSQGTIVALQAGLTRDNKLAGIIGYSGAVADPERLQTEIRSRCPILLVHGEADDALPLHYLEEAKEVLERLVWPVRTVTVPGLGHSIDPTGLKAADDFLREVLPPKFTAGWSSAGQTRFVLGADGRPK